jgi:hypothetical protein
MIAAGTSVRGSVPASEIPRSTLIAISDPFSCRLVDGSTATAPSSSGDGRT